MPEIVMQVDAVADRQKVMHALTSETGIAGWWTDQVELSAGSPPMLKTAFTAAPMPFDLKVDEASDARVVWHAQSFPPNWVGSEVRIDLSDNPDGPGTRILFTHEGFPPGDPGVPPVAYTWGQCLGRLKGYVETGTPQPYFVK